LGAYDKILYPNPAYVDTYGNRSRTNRSFSRSRCACSP
jgi:hypothetical protein